MRDAEIVRVEVNYYGDDGLSAQVLAKLEEMSAQMAELQDAFDAMRARATEDYQHLSGLLDQALATDTANQAEIDRLKAERDVVIASAAQFDLDTSFPAAPPQPDVPEPQPEPTPEPQPTDQPVDGQPADGGTPENG